jgi:hypothetical protein
MQFVEMVAKSRPTTKERAKCMEFYAEMKLLKHTDISGCNSAPCGLLQKHYKQSDTAEVKRVTATQGITACNSAPCGLLLENTINKVMYHFKELQFCNKNAITLHEFDLLETVQTSRVTTQHSPTSPW